MITRASGIRSLGMTIGRDSMTQITLARPGGPPEPLSPADARLKKTALQLEGLFVQRLFAAMRDTVPQDGMFSGGSAETTFTTMLDEKLAEQAPKQWDGKHSLGQPLYRQFRQRLSASELTTGTGTDAAVHDASTPLQARIRTTNATPTPR